MAEKSKNPYTLDVGITISGIDGYSTREVFKATLHAMGPLDIEGAISEAKALASKCINAIREAADRAKVATATEKPVDTDAIL